MKTELLGIKKCQRWGWSNVVAVQEISSLCMGYYQRLVLVMQKGTSAGQYFGCRAPLLLTHINIAGDKELLAASARRSEYLGTNLPCHQVLGCILSPASCTHCFLPVCLLVQTFKAFFVSLFLSVRMLDCLKLVILACIKLSLITAFFTHKSDMGKKPSSSLGCFEPLSFVRPSFLLLS